MVLASRRQVLGDGRLPDYVAVNANSDLMYAAVMTSWKGCTDRDQYRAA
jgi:hypothetical protein